MPLSTNAPFSEFGHSMVLRDLEQIYLLLGGVGTGSPGDASTQDQALGVSQEVGADGAVGARGRDGADGSSGEASSICGKPVGTLSPTNGEQFLKYNQATAQWEPFDIWNSSAATGWVNVYDSSVAEELATNRGVMAGTARSVFGRAAATDGLPACITATADGQVLQRSGGTLQFLALSGSLPTAPTGAGWVLAHDGSSAAWDTTVQLGNTTTAGSVTIANTSYTDAIIISPTLVTTTGKKLTVREIDVCDAGVAKKMLVLGSAAY